jgi:flagellar biosynthesis protein FlhG
MDQAAGLRSLFRPRRLRVVSVLAAGDAPEKTAVVVNFAAAAARQGLNVVVLDQSYGEVPRALGYRARFELGHVLEGDCSLVEVAVKVSKTLWVVPAARGLEKLAAANCNGSYLRTLFTPLTPDLDLIVMNAMSHATEAPCKIAARADCGREMLFLTSARLADVRASYAQIKQLVRTAGRQELRLVVSRAPSEASAQRVFQNIAGATRNHGLGCVRYGGFLPHEASLAIHGGIADTKYTQTQKSSSARAFDRMAANCFEWSLPEFHSRASRPVIHQLGGS